MICKLTKIVHITYFHTLPKIPKKGQKFQFRDKIHKSESTGDQEINCKLQIRSIGDTAPLLTTALSQRRGLHTSVTPRAMLAGAQAPSRATHARQVKGQRFD